MNREKLLKIIREEIQTTPYINRAAQRSDVRREEIKPLVAKMSTMLEAALFDEAIAAGRKIDASVTSRAQKISAEFRQACVNLWFECLSSAV